MSTCQMVSGFEPGESCLGGIAMLCGRRSLQPTIGRDLKVASEHVDCTSN
jgi:hypothetical protein